MSVSATYIDTDTHLWDQYDDWTRYVDDDRLLDHVPQFVDGAAGRKKILVEGTVFPANAAHPGVVPAARSTPTTRSSTTRSGASSTWTRWPPGST